MAAAAIATEELIRDSSQFGTGPCPGCKIAASEIARGAISRDPVQAAYQEAAAAHAVTYYTNSAEVAGTTYPFGSFSKAASTDVLIETKEAYMGIDACLNGTATTGVASCFGFEAGAGSDGSGTFDSCESGGTGITEFTCASDHGLSNGQIIFITTTAATTYDGVYAVFNCTLNTKKFSVLKAAGDTRAGFWSRPSSLRLADGYDGIYRIGFSFSLTGTTANNYVITAYKNTTQQLNISMSETLDANLSLTRIFTAEGLLSLVAGDYVSFGVTNLTAANKAVIGVSSVTISKVSAS